MRTIMQNVLAGLTCVGLFVAGSIVAATPAHAQQGGRAAVHAVPSASVPHQSGRRFIWGGNYWYPGYGGYGYGGYGYSEGGFNPGFADPYGVFGGSAPSQGFGDPYGVFGGPSIFD